MSARDWMSITARDWVAILVGGGVIFVGRVYDFGWGVIIVVDLVAIAVAVFVYEAIRARKQ